MILEIVKTDVPMTPRLCRETIAQLAEAYPFFRRQTLTQTAFGRPVEALVIGEGDRQVIFSGTHHANEWITSTLLLKFAEALAQAIQTKGKIWGVPADTVFRASTLHIIPMVNPDGAALVTKELKPGSLEFTAAQLLSDNYPQIPFPAGWKANLLGVDLNLQYPAGWLQAREIKYTQGYTLPGPRDYVGRAPLMQLESAALAEYTRQVDPAVVLAYHTQGRVIYWQFRDYEVPGAEDLAREFARVSSYSLEETPYQSSFAGYKDWFIQSFGRPGFTIEVGSGTNPLPIEQFSQIYRENLGILMTAALGLPGGV